MFLDLRVFLSLDLDLGWYVSVFGFAVVFVFGILMYTNVCICINIVFLLPFGRISRYLKVT